MEHTSASLGTDDHPEIPYREEATKALAQVLSNGLPVFYRQAYRLLSNRADAEDAVQDALLAAYTHLDQFKGQSQMSTGVTAIVLNCARMRLRKRLRCLHVPLDEPIGQVQILSISERLADGRPNPEDEYRNAELNTYLMRFHGRLSPTLRRTFQLRAIDGLSVRETAQILGMPHGTVKAQFARARKKLKELMRPAVKGRSCRLLDRLPGFGVRQVCTSSLEQVSSGALNETVIMLKDQEPHRNINDLTDEEIYYEIHGLEPPSKIERGTRSWWLSRTAIIFLILLLGVIAFIWFGPRGRVIALQRREPRGINWRVPVPGERVAGWRVSSAWPTPISSA